MQEFCRKRNTKQAIAPVLSILLRSAFTIVRRLQNEMPISLTFQHNSVKICIYMLILCSFAVTVMPITLPTPRAVIRFHGRRGTRGIYCVEYGIRRILICILPSVCRYRGGFRLSPREKHIVLLRSGRRIFVKKFTEMRLFFFSATPNAIFHAEKMILFCNKAYMQEVFFL